MVEFSIREVKARFAEAAAAAAGGERVIVTKHGRPFVELVPARASAGMDFDKAALVREELGLGGLTVSMPPDFDDPAFSAKFLASTSEAPSRHAYCRLDTPRPRPAELP